MLNGNQAVAFEWSFAGLALIFVLLRLYVKVFYGPSSKLHWSDWVVVIAWLNFAACCTCDVELNRLGFIDSHTTYIDSLSKANPDPEKTVRILKIIYFSFFPYLIDSWLVKASILSFYYAVIPRSIPLYRWFLHVTAGVCVATFMLALFSNIFWCYPIRRNWSLEGGEVCVASAKEPPFFLTVCSTLITDLLIFCLPFPLLQSLHLTRRKMLGVTVLFALGSLTILAAICRLAVIAKASLVTEVIAWAAVECSAGIMVACAPAFRVLLIRRERNPSSSGLTKSTRPYARPGPPILSASDRNEIWDGTDATAPHWIRMASIPGSTAVSPREQQFDDAVIEALSKQLTPNRNSRDFRDSSFSNFDMVAQIPNMRLQLGRGIVEHAPMSPHTRSPVDDHMTIGSISPRTLSPLTSPDFVRLDHRPGSEDVPLNRWDTGESGRLELGRIVETAAGANRPRSISRASGNNSPKSGLRGFL